jgi:chaperonin cofactor prefoldin
MTLQEINDSYKAKAKARTSPTMTTRVDRDELRIQHVVSSQQRKQVNFDKLRERVEASLEVAQTISAKTTGIRKHFKGSNSLGQFDHLRNQLNALVAVLQTLKLKLA